jgi:Phosphotransferase enzyme family
MRPTRAPHQRARQNKPKVTVTFGAGTSPTWPAIWMCPVGSRPGSRSCRVLPWLPGTQLGTVSPLSDRKTDALVLGRGLHLANFLRDGTRVRIVDFEDSGSSDRAFELAILVLDYRWATRKPIECGRCGRF